MTFPLFLALNWLGASAGCFVFLVEYYKFKSKVRAALYSVVWPIWFVR